MNQIIYFILLLSLIVYSSTAAGSTCEETEASKSNCKTYTNLNAEEKEEGDSCCYVIEKCLVLKLNHVRLSIKKMLMKQLNKLKILVLKVLVLYAVLIG